VRTAAVVSVRGRPARSVLVYHTLQRWPVSKRVNSSRAADDDPTLIEIGADVATADINWLRISLCGGQIDRIVIHRLERRRFLLVVLDDDTTGTVPGQSCRMLRGGPENPRFDNQRRLFGTCALLARAGRRN
jgi:hypothetical protein